MLFLKFGNSVGVVMSAHLDICGKQFDVGLYLDCFSKIHNICVMDDLHRDLPFTFVFKIDLKVKKMKIQFPVPVIICKYHPVLIASCPSICFFLLVSVLMKMSLSQAFTFYFVLRMVIFRKGVLGDAREEEVLN